MLAIATRGREHNGHEGGMLNFTYSLLVLPALFLFMASVASSEGGGAIRRRKRVEHPYINKDALESATPHTTSRNVRPSLLLRDSCAMAEGLSGDGLEVGFHCHVVSDLPQSSGGDVPHLVVSQRREATKRARQGVTHIQLLTAHAEAWEPRRCPAVPEAQAIPEISLAECETMAAVGAAGQPAGCTLF